MKPLISFFVLIFIYISLSAQQVDTIYLWPGAVPGETEPKHPAVVDSNRSGNTTRLTDVTNPMVVEFIPEEGAFNGSSVVICPGGAYNILSIDKEGYEIAEWLNTLGYKAFVLQYRVPQKQEGALQDVQRALRIARSRTGASGKVGVLGFSAGGSLSARASTRFNEKTYEPVDHLDELSCRPDFTVLIYPAYLDHGPGRTLTPELTITGETPPMFLFGTIDDKYGNSALVMTGALRDAGIPAELHMLPAGGHGYGLRPGNAAGERWPLLCAKWMESVR
ncbi:MAG: alpha/beta hydrolase [Bacteroidales bacterium]|nr:alpha/beta hydrolase [Bacteroidales bacterium]